MRDKFRIGVVFPQTEIEADASAIRDYAKAVEELGFDHIVAYDHVIGADVTNRPDWNMPYTHESAFHEPLTLFSFLAGVTSRIELVSGVVVLPQRQTVLFAKQAANADIFSGGRLRLGIGLGWNKVEFTALNQSFEDRAARLEEQVRILRRLWTEDSFSEDACYHRIEEAGINPLPVQRPIPILIGGSSPAALRRAARIGDGWLPVLPRPWQDPTPDVALEAKEMLAKAVEEAGRPPDSVALENITFLGSTFGRPARDPAYAAMSVDIWKAAGARAITFQTMDMGLQGGAGHLTFLRTIAEHLGIRTG